jgi:hypothetical protein
MPERARAGVVSPSTGFGGASLRTEFSDGAIDQSVIDGKKLLVVQGCFAYRTFNRTHHSAFCFFYSGKTSKGGNLNNCITGNNAD